MVSSPGFLNRQYDNLFLLTSLWWINVLPYSTSMNKLATSLVMHFSGYARHYRVCSIRYSFNRICNVFFLGVSCLVFLSWRECVKGIYLNSSGHYSNHNFSNFSHFFNFQNRVWTIISIYEKYATSLTYEFLLEWIGQTVCWFLLCLLFERSLAGSFCLIFSFWRCITRKVMKIIGMYYKKLGRGLSWATETFL